MNGLKKSEKNWEANDMSNLHIVPTQVTLSRKCGISSTQLFTFGPRGQGIALRGS